MQKILDGDEALWEAYRDEAPMLTEMAKLSKVLRQKRKERGAVDFDFPESKIELDENGEPLSIHPHERNDATKLIEGFYAGGKRDGGTAFLLAGGAVFIPRTR